MLDHNSFAFMSQVRFEYENITLAGFIEMSPEWSQDSPKVVIRKFRHALLAVPGITQVKLHPEGTKKQQNNGGSHYQEHNFVVYTETTGQHWMEFELTRNDHMSGEHNFTVTACFKQPRREHVPEAWRVLTQACRSNALLPTVVDMNYRKAIASLGVDLPKEVRGPGRGERRKSQSSQAGANKKQKSSNGESDPMAKGYSVSPDHPSSDLLVTDDEAAGTSTAGK